MSPVPKVRFLFIGLFVLILLSGCRPPSETFTVWTPTADDDHYVNNAVPVYFKGRFYCMWQSSATDEDTPDTHLVYSGSRNGRKWSKPRTLAPATDSTFASAGGWLTAGDTLVAFINMLSDIQSGGMAWYATSIDGKCWSAPQPVRMADGTPLNGILEQDIHTLPDGRLVGAAHFRPGLHARPVWTDDPTGRSGWHIGLIEMEDRGVQSRGIEPSLFLRSDGMIVMLFRDQASSFRKMVSESRDRGETWTEPVVTDIPDNRSKQCAGNLPDGRAFYIGGPGPGKDRTTLAIAWSEDGSNFTDPLPFRTQEDLPPQQYPGKYKTLGYSYPKAIVHDGAIYVAYTENKERVVLTRIRFLNGN